MSFCRICRTENNLKYTSKELRRINKKLVNNTKDLLYAVPVTQTGNICFDCEERLLNFNKHIDSDVEVDCGTGTIREDSPVIVDDDELLYNMFFNKQEVRAFEKLPINKTPRREFTPQSLGSDGDTEIIEVLNSSRESTPSHPFKGDGKISSDMYVDKIKQITAIVPAEIIDLERVEQEAKSEMDKIIFRRVDNVIEAKKTNCNETRNIQRKRKRLADCDVKLVASLSLVSSDSETETVQPVSKSTPEFLKQPPVHPCDMCELKFLNLSDLKSHQSMHNSVNCPVCNAFYTLSQRLVQHMRKKHRSYSGDVLKERIKCSQDSAMTIRLRYLQRHTYYECQLCGQIDSVFKEHKDHIITQHPAESKSLKDPMMKELTCPICKAMCGTQYLTLCAHLRAAHRDKHVPQLKEVLHTHPLGWSFERQKAVEATSKVFQFSSRKSRYFECIRCRNLSPGYFNHWKHLRTHGRCTPIPHADNQANNHKIRPATRKDATKNKKNLDATKKIEIKNEQTNSISKGKIQRPKEHNKTLPAACALKTGINRKQAIKKMSHKALKTAALVKVKPRVLHFPTLEYNCKYCSETFKGFHIQNMHHIKKHSLDEYNKWQKCNTANDKPKNQRTHISQKTSRRHFKSKSKLETTPLLDENSNTTYKHPHRSSFGPVAETNPCTHQTSLEGANRWLQDLMQFSRRPQLDSGGKTDIHQCEYCTHLFSDHNALLTHERQHIEKQDIKLIKRIPCNVEKSECE